MDSLSHRILRANLVELKELAAEFSSRGLFPHFDAIKVTILERSERYERGEFYTPPGDSGTSPHTN